MKIKSGGGWHAIGYTLKKARQMGGFWRMWKALRSKNACKTCALGMGGQKGGMVNEAGHFPEVCKKSLQAMAADMQGGIKSDFWQTYSVAQLRKFTPRQLEECGRLVQPLLLEKSESHYRPIEWSDAIQRLVGKLKTIDANESFWYFSGRSSNEAGFLLQLFARLYGTNNVNNCSYYCHQASGVGLTSIVGSGTATITLDDLEKADTVFVIGGNPPSNHPRIMTSLKRVRRRGGKVVVINPVRELGLINFKIPSDPISLLFGTKIATQYVQPHIGGDLALLLGIGKRIVETNAVDENFVANHTVGFEEWKSNAVATSWDEIETKSGVTRKEINAIAETYAKSENAVFCWTMGITHHEHGVQNVQAIGNLAILRGMLGKKYAGLMPIRGHSNVQGIGSVGVTPKLKDKIFESLQSNFSVNLPTTEGLDTLGCMEAAHTGSLKFGFCLGGNLYGSNPDSTFAEQSLGKLETVAYMSTTLNTGHFYGCGDETIILPVLARDEEPEPTTQESMFNFVRLSDGGSPRHEGPRSEVSVISEIASKCFQNKHSVVDWNDLRKTGNIRSMIAQVIPGYEAIEKIEETKKEFQIGGRTFHQPEFSTPSGKAILHPHSIPALKGGEQNDGSIEFRLMTVRSEGQFNTVVYEEADVYRGQTRRDIILIHPNDIERLGMANGDPVTVASSVGSMNNILLSAYSDIREGNVLMYFPESNVLVSRDSDAKSKTPAFKGMTVTIKKN